MNHSTAKSNITSCEGTFNVFNTMIIIIRLAEGTEETANDDVKAKRHTVQIWPTPNGIPFIWAIKMAETDIMIAVPSVLQFAPIGKMKRVIRESIFSSSCITWKVTGKAAALL